MLDKLYYQAHLSRMARYQKGAEKLSIPVLSVGNLTLGGTGKTPFVAWLAKRLFQEGLKVGIASRGYPHKISQALLVPPGANPMEIGDEPALLAQTLKGEADVAVCLSRSQAGQVLIREKGIQVLILDDGFQHFSLKRDLDIVLLDSQKPFGKNGKLLPYGTLREPPEALKRAGAFVLTNARAIPYKDLNPLCHRLHPWNPAAPILSGSPAIKGLVGREGDLPLDLLAGGKVFLLSAIACPDRFVSTVRLAGLEISGQQFFRDHHAFTQKDLDQVGMAAKTAGAKHILCTEKDWVKLTRLRMEDVPIYALGIRFEPLEEPESFWSLVMERVKAFK